MAQIAPRVQVQYRLLEEAFGRELIDELYTVLDKVISGPHCPRARIALPASVPIGAGATQKPRRVPRRTPK